jgi:hypothetical protein
MKNRGDLNKRFYSWRDKNIARYEFTVNRKTDPDVFEMLDLQPSRRGYIMNLIRKDIAEKNKIIEERRKEREKK